MHCLGTHASLRPSFPSKHEAVGFGHSNSCGEQLPSLLLADDLLIIGLALQKDSLCGRHLGPLSPPLADWFSVSARGKFNVLHR